jgi:hypothetical protein
LKARHCQLAFAGASVRVDARGARASLVADVVCQSMPARASRQPPVAYYELSEAGGANLALTRNGHSCGLGPESAITARLLEGATHDLVTGCRLGVVLHAGAVALPSGAMLLPGASGTGKSTLVAWLLSRGHRYLTDELAFIPSGSGRVHGLARPLSLRMAAVRALRRRHITIRDPNGGTVRSHENVLVPPGLIAAGPVPRVARIARIVFPRFCARARFRVEAVSPAEAAGRLMECLVNAKNLPGHGLSEVARIARHYPSQSITYGDLAQVGRWWRHSSAP